MTIPFESAALIIGPMDEAVKRPTGMGSSGENLFANRLTGGAGCAMMRSKLALTAKLTTAGGHRKAGTVMNLGPFVSRPHLIWYKMFALSSLVLATTLLSTPAARAGGWVFTCTGSGSNTDTHPYFTGALPDITYWTPPGPQTGQFSLGQFGGGNDYSESDVATITVTVTATWTHGTGQDDTSDPAPPNVWLCESASAAWTMGSSGSADDGFGDAAVPYSDGSPGAISFTATSNPPPYVPQPPPHWKEYAVSGNSVTLPTRTLSAEGDFSPTQDRPYGDNCYAYVNGYSVTVHATPYNFKKVVGGGNIGFDGTLSFTYDWLSTTGNKNDLIDCFWHEYVTYSGPVGTADFPNKYYPQNPPFDFSPGGNYLANPFVSPGTQRSGGPMTGTNQAVDTQNVPPLVDPSLYTYGTFTATQVYQYDDVAVEDSNIQIPGPDSGPFSIVREFKYYDPNNYRYTVTKDTRISSVLKPLH